MDLLAEFQWGSSKRWCTTSCIYQHLYFTNSIDDCNIHRQRHVWRVNGIIFNTFNKRIFINTLHYENTVYMESFSISDEINLTSWTFKMPRWVEVLLWVQLLILWYSRTVHSLLDLYVGLYQLWATKLYRSID